MEDMRALGNEAEVVQETFKANAINCGGLPRCLVVSPVVQLPWVA